MNDAAEIFTLIDELRCEVAALKAENAKRKADNGG